MYYLKKITVFSPELIAPILTPSIFFAANCSQIGARLFHSSLSVFMKLTNVTPALISASKLSWSKMTTALLVISSLGSGTISRDYLAVENQTENTKILVFSVWFGI